MSGPGGRAPAADRNPLPPEPWRLREPRFEPSLATKHETLFSLGNGRLGMRGTFEEGFPGASPGTYLNGFYEETPIVYGEVAYGYARNRQIMLNVADARLIALRVDGEPFDLSTGTILAYERTLDFKAGLLQRTVRWRSPGGGLLELSSRRLVSLRRPAVAAIEWTVSTAGSRLEIASSIDGRPRERKAGDDPRIGVRFRERPLLTRRVEADGPRGLLVQRTRTTGFSLACAMDHEIGDGEVGAAADGDITTVTVRTAGNLRVTKFLGYATSRNAGEAEIADVAGREAAAARAAGFEALMAEQREVLDGFWRAADVRIDGDPALQQGLRFNLFSLFQSAGRDGRTSISAKGLTGDGYEGHYFWDTEIYVLPFFLYTLPGMARGLLRYRCSILDKARARAVEMGHRGALFPWRTIGGEETSPYFPAGSAQYHINADIVHAFRRYEEATDDRTILREGGAEMVFETARLWADLGAYHPRRGGAFCIDEVTGPDEYSALADNNLYTNLMARENLAYAADLAERMREEDPEGFLALARAIRLLPEEIEEWRRAAAAMYVPFDRALGVHAQDDRFLDHIPWDFAATPADRYPLMLHYHPLVIYRHQVLKQPDVVLAQVLLSGRFTMAEKRRNFDYYDPLTTGDSSLSPCIQSIAAAELGYTAKAYEYFARTARMDLDDVNGNVEDGVHTAAMAGTWLSVVFGFAGLRDGADLLSFSPRLPDRWERLCFHLGYRGRRLAVEVTRTTATYALEEGEALSIRHRNRTLRLDRGAAVRVDLAPVLAAVVFHLGASPAAAPGLVTLLADLRAREIRSIGIRAAAGARSIRTVDEAGFDVILEESDALKEPPDPELFYRAADAVLEPGENCAAVCVSRDGVRAAAAAGMLAVAMGIRCPEADWSVTEAAALSVKGLRERFARGGRP